MATPDALSGFIEVEREPSRRGGEKVPPSYSGYAAVVKMFFVELYIDRSMSISRRRSRISSGNFVGYCNPSFIRV